MGLEQAVRRGAAYLPPQVKGALSAEQRRSILRRVARVRTLRPTDQEPFPVGRLNAIARSMPSCTSYLEIGVNRGATLEAVRVPFKWGVDPDCWFNVRTLPSGIRVSTVTSDEFFDRLPSSVRFDLVYLDGLHEWRQTYRDLINAFVHGHEQTVVLIDDVIPLDDRAALPAQEAARAERAVHGEDDSAGWSGDVYRLLFLVWDRHDELECWVVSDGQNRAQAIVWRRPGTALPVLTETTSDDYPAEAYLPDATLGSSRVAGHAGSDQEILSRLPWGQEGPPL